MSLSLLFLELKLLQHCPFCLSGKDSLIFSSVLPESKVKGDEDSRVRRLQENEQVENERRVSCVVSEIQNYVSVE